MFSDPSFTASITPSITPSFAAPLSAATAPDIPQLRSWLLLAHLEGLSPHLARQMLQFFGSPTQALQAAQTGRTKDLSGWTAQFGAAVAARLRAALPRAQAHADAALRWLDGGNADTPRALLTLDHPNYPAALLQTADPPLVLYAAGRQALLAHDSLAVVGSRKATTGGCEHARRFARTLGQAGLTIVSGLARGIDGAAHEAALDTLGGTIAVIGTGIDLIYPLRHQALAQRLYREGLVLSEFAIGLPGLTHHFPRRNRLIAGLSLGVLVVEAAERSGSLITARLANEAGREVFAIPGSIDNPQASGCHALIRQGARLVSDPADILDDLAPLRRPARPEPVEGPTEPAPNPSVRPEPVEGPTHAPLPADHQHILRTLGHDPIDQDHLIDNSGLQAARVLAALITLELDGLIERLPGGRYQRLPDRR